MNKRIDRPMSEVYWMIKNLEKQVESIHERISESLGIAINCLDFGHADTERTMPDVEGALEMLRDIKRELEG